MIFMRFHGPQALMDTSDILVPDVVGEPQGGDDSGEQAFWEGKI
jgi:hypothetical protein